MNKEDRKFVCWLIVFSAIVGIIFFFVSMWCYENECLFKNKNSDCQSQLSECQYNLRTYNLENLNLEIEYTCGIVNGYWSFNSYGDYMNAISVLEKQGCEVLDIGEEVRR